MDLTSERRDRNTTEREQLTAQLATVNKEIKKLEASTGSREESIKTLQDKIHTVEDEIFHAFSAEVGVENVREYETARLNRAKEQSEMRLRFSTQKARIEHLLAYEEQRDLKKTADDAQRKLDEDKQKLKEIMVIINCFSFLHVLGQFRKAKS